MTFEFSYVGKGETGILVTVMIREGGRDPIFIHDVVFHITEGILDSRLVELFPEIDMEALSRSCKEYLGQNGHFDGIDPIYS